MDNGRGGDFVSLVGYSPDYLKLHYVQTSNVIQGAVYRVQYRSRNQIGWSAFSPISFILAASAPSPPPAPSFVLATSVGITLSLSSTTNNGGSPVTSYTLYADAGNDFTSPFSVLTQYDGTSSTYTATVAADGLVNGKVYRFAYSASNA